MRVPEHLQHKPIIGVDDYDKLDGYRANNTDAKALSIGKAQWDENEISAKIWRHTTGDNTGKWSRQSEEVPLNRILDLALLIAAQYIPHNEDEEYKTPLNEVVINQRETKKLDQFMSDNKEILLPKLQELKNILSKIDCKIK